MIPTVNRKYSVSTLVEPEAVFQKIRPGTRIFISSGMAEPQTLLKYLMSPAASKLDDIELVQLFSLSNALSAKTLSTKPFRLKTFCSGWTTEETIVGGCVDLIPSRLTAVADLIRTGLVPIDVAFVQVTPPNEAGYCSFGVAVDVAREAMEAAAFTVGEINPYAPYTFGDTYVPVDEFDMLVESPEPPLTFQRQLTTDIHREVAGHVAGLIGDESCLAFSTDPLYEALAERLVHKRHLGIHSPVFTDALMDLMRSGAVTNRRKESYRGKTLTSYAYGSKALMRWLDHNPLIEFQRSGKVFNPQMIGRNPNFAAVIAARMVDLTGRIGLADRNCTVDVEQAEVLDMVNGAQYSRGGKTIIALSSRNQDGEPNILPTLNDAPHRFDFYEAVTCVVTEYGVANLNGKTLRERAQALIDIAHPDDRRQLVEKAKSQRVLYADQIFIAESGRLYPQQIRAVKVLKNNLEVVFRPIKPSDEEDMRRLFYRFSDESVYSRYFHTIKSMPHTKMQTYVNVDWNQVMSIVGLSNVGDQRRIIAEGRYVRIPADGYAELVFVVDEQCQGLGIATYLYKMLCRLAKERGIRGFVADVLFSNIGMMKVFKKGDLPVKAHLEAGVYNLRIPFN